MLDIKTISDTNRLSHAYIVSPALIETVAMTAVCSTQGKGRPCFKCNDCSKALRGIHPDISIIKKPEDKREIVIDQIREIKKSVIVIPNDAEKKVYIVEEADSMNESAQNAFLQMLEEPPVHAVFILGTENPAELLKTVRSRCVELKASPVSETANPESAEITEMFFSALTQGNAAITSLMFRLEKLDKQEMENFLSEARSDAIAKLKDHNNTCSIGREKLVQAEKVLSKAADMLLSYVGTGHISGLICATFIETEN